MISYNDSVKLVKEKRDYYNALLRNGYRAPDLKQSIVTCEFMIQVSEW